MGRFPAGGEPPPANEPHEEPLDPPSLLVVASDLLLVPRRLLVVESVRYEQRGRALSKLVAWLIQIVGPVRDDRVWHLADQVEQCWRDLASYEFADSSWIASGTKPSLTKACNFEPLPCRVRPTRSLLQRARTNIASRSLQWRDRASCAAPCALARTRPCGTGRQGDSVLHDRTRRSLC